MIEQIRGLFKGSLQEQFQFRMILLITFVGNILYLIVVYAFWKEIYISEKRTTIAGMTFNETMVYLVLASAMFYCLEMYIVWEIGRTIQAGKIMFDLVKPMDYFGYIFWRYSGGTFINFIFTFIPTFFIVKLLTGSFIELGKNVILFLISLILGMIINYCINFITGMICIYTKTTWGVNIMKEAIVLLFSGATIPLDFFPYSIRIILERMPFASIYNYPLKILINDKLQLEELITFLGIQFFWGFILVLLSKVVFKYSLNNLVINGG